CAAGKGDYW
nr:immunoglobulin heavy chain junction region [Mus musculus]NSM04613.1 immunoglobulin heavy chain junction region [Mus musculus]NSM05626.1 immunoglobulin heavy chain junction region [Mus musculus]NSM09276.1 immunoglobulin heavy chain junction region [Mus musculus]NSM09471.1 immunoglobulin heavy chain junction region [Mus musculus]